ncbi:hypothetical protein [Cryobacterium zhongshanensis]|uniref:Uncharacterized protein n=1 Tax=Cryobacterium zhongshanensis TaxID=2928153 RepID=A0AA41QX56_9MICO|nr:hypothetical protein [Cryobacterium zhongshanensis]MCI4658213.1 hypothetical protein [Cryobacterium zhongshanensis]
MPIETSAATATVVLRPRRWRFWFGTGFAVLCTVATLVFVAANAAHSGFAWLALFFLVPGIVVMLKGGVRSRALTIVPGSHLEYRDRLLRRQRVESDATTEILQFATVEESNFVPIRSLRTPIGVMDERWAVLRTGNATVLRLSMWVWTTPDLLAIAEALPAKLRIHNESIAPWTIDREHPDYYTWLEKHPRTYLAVFYGIILGVVLSVLAGLAGLILVRMTQ